MISIGNKQLVDCQVGSKKVKEIYKGSKKVWPTVNYVLLYEEDIQSYSNFSETVATIPDYTEGMPVKIKVIATYISGDWVTHSPNSNSGEQSLEMGPPPNTQYIDFSAETSPYTLEYDWKGNTASFFVIHKAATFDYAHSQASLKFLRNGELVKSGSYVRTQIPSSKVHVQVYYAL